MKKIFLVLAIFGVFAIGAAVFYFYHAGFSIYLTEEELQARVEEAFPIEQRHMRIVEVRLLEPRVNLLEGSDRIHYVLRANASIAGLGDVIEARARGSGTIRYDAGQAAFFFEDFRIEELDSTGIPAQQREWVREGVGIALGQAFRYYPIHRLGRDGPLDFAARLTLRDVRVVDQRLRLSLGIRRGDDTSGRGKWFSDATD